VTLEKRTSTPDSAECGRVAIDERECPGKLASMGSPLTPAGNDGIALTDVGTAPIQNRDGASASLSTAGTRTSASSNVTDLVGEHRRKPLVIGIAGGSGSGKSTVARKVAEALSRSSIAFLDMDAYYRNFAHLPMEERKRLNWDHPDAFDMELFAAQVRDLCAGRSIDKPVYDFVSHTRSARTERVDPADVLVLDGILLFVDELLRSLFDVKVFVDADADIRLIRRLRRDVQKRGRTLDDVIKQYLETVQPMHLQFVEPSKRYADVIVPRGGHNTIAIEMIVAKIHHRLRGRPA
jgi:uridine kinase